MGNTRVTRCDSRNSSVHPHPRGEHDTATPPGWPSAGSSPPTWGTLCPAQRYPRRRRFIPTHVGNTCSPASMPCCCAVHPHPRGEHTTPWKVTTPTVGSSPPTWGTLQTVQTCFSDARFIPTHVGNTQFVIAGGPPGPVHPHPRGEHPRTGANGFLGDGSSPPTWGTPDEGGRRVRSGRFIPTHVGNTAVQRDDGGRSRFIPTHVGNTTSRPAVAGSLAVHPHPRGEHSESSAGGLHALGSSPPTWGTPCEQRRDAGEGRFIPTHVGNTKPFRRNDAFRAVHPHPRGEHKPRRGPGRPAAGSSPPTWGTPLDGLPRVEKIRFIPTHVGNTWGNRWPRRWRTVHPHPRGEHALLAVLGRRLGGSSPPTWGTRRHHHPGPGGRRFIPTHVGNTTPAWTRGTTRSVHPHPRGEHPPTAEILQLGFGSSPPTWGTQGLEGQQCPWVRFIPTHVGNTAMMALETACAAVHPHPRGEHGLRDARLQAGGGSSPPTWGTRSGPPARRPGLRFIPTHVGNTRKRPRS
ncbi:hypothetical protein DEIPH_ctg002orf0130 [Deinococcus phoenicis]|uniref:Uncharacterized protein n=1 Tax=Deinococcus phoenicis TaxID=1476583 RepID=A0A016QUL3_9DEIO|nr:hypothetical protein DEIPH_ctg002orf0130 [Deinococcus phoenicis]